MDVREIMSTHVYQVRQEESTAAAATHMQEADVGCLVVVGADLITGVITDRDLAVRCLSESHDSRECRVEEHMSSPAITVGPAADMLEAAHTMTTKSIRRLPVVDGDELVGLVSLSDIALAIDTALDSMQGALHDLLLGMGATRSA